VTPQARIQKYLQPTNQNKTTQRTNHPHIKMGSLRFKNKFPIHKQNIARIIGVSVPARSRHLALRNEEPGIAEVGGTPKIK
jgi:hypothetical protein